MSIKNDASQTMAGPEIAQLQLHLPGLLKLLGENLYSNPQVAFRELVQNAHDSCVRQRLAADAAGEPYSPRIDVRTRRDGASALVTVSDNGEGLDAEQIREFLATIGRGRTAQVRAALESTGSDAAYDLVGQFGVGLLSAFLVADRVEVVTRRRDRVDGFRWVCEGQQSYRLEPCEVRDPGTTVRLRIRREAPELGHPELVRDALRRYARYLQVPIHFDGEYDPINDAVLPWHASIHDAWDARPTISAETLCRDLCGASPPLAVFELQPFEHPSLGRVPLHGALCIPEGSYVSVVEYGEATVLIRRMVITERERDLLPPWARFVTGVVECPLLQPTASREQVRQDDVYRAVQEGIADQLLAHLGDLRRSRPAAWGAVVRAHAAILKTWAVRHPDLFEAVADQLLFQTTRGELTLPEYLDASGGTIYYFGSEQEARVMTLLLESTSRPVVDAQWFGDEPFLRVYAETRGVRIVRELGASRDGVLSPVEDPGVDLAALAVLFADRDLRVTVASFEPESVPALVVTPRRLEVQGRARAALDQDRLMPSFRTLVSRYAEPDAGPARVLYLNARSPIVSELARRVREGEPVGPAVRILGQLARVFSGERLSPVELARAAGECSTALGDLIGAGAMQPVATGTRIGAAWAREVAGLTPELAERLTRRVGTFEALVAADAAELARDLGLAEPIVAAIQSVAAGELDDDPAMLDSAWPS
jgi:molecular chaperone HtpG